MPEKWQDPFENIILKSKLKMQNGESGNFCFHNSLYGQCWTLESASDAIWQIYSRKQDGIRVRTTVGKLIDSLSANQPDWAASSCFIGRVEYLTENGLREFGRNIFNGGITAESVARSLLVKRKAYKHENEVRLIYFEPSLINHPNGVYKYKFKPLSVIDQVMIDGRVSYEDFVTSKSKIIKSTNLKRGRIKRSLLYAPPKNFVVEIP